MKTKEKIQQAVSLVVCLLIVSSLAIVRQGEWMGYDFKAGGESAASVSEGKASSAETANDTIRILDDGTAVVNTTALASDISGYGGKVPLEITIKDNRVVSVKALPNAETKDFFDEAAVLLSRWNGKTLDEAIMQKVDAVSGATFTSKGIIGNMQRGLAYAQTRLGQREAAGADGGTLLSAFDWSAKSILGLVVVLMAAVLPLYVKNRKYRLFQSVLNVAVLGFWCGAFLSYTSLIGYAAHGMDIIALAVPFVMLVTAFVYPLFGKKTYYCTHVCPFGSLQQLAGKCVAYKVKMSPAVLHRLDNFRQVLWGVLMLLIYLGVWSDWVDYEPFSAFIFQTASWAVIALASVFVLLSLVVTRPYCRFVCPMGTLLRLSQNTSK